MSIELTAILERLETSRIVTDADVLALRQAVFGDGYVSTADADAIFRISDSAEQKVPAWAEFFLEAITDFTVRQTQPYGYVDDSNAAWLISRISKDGHVETLTELRTLVNILRLAQDSTDRLVSFALLQVRDAVMHGSGVIGRGRVLEPGVIGAAEVNLLRDVIYACGGENHIGISRAEAEVLFDLNDACRDAPNDASWQDLFVKGIGNYLMFLSSYATPDRNEVLRREQWLTERVDLSLLGVAKNLRYKDVMAAFGGNRDKKREEAARTDAFNAEVNMAETIDGDEAEWLSSRLGRDGQFDDNERALMAFLKAESPSIHAALEPWLQAA